MCLPSPLARTSFFALIDVHARVGKWLFFRLFVSSRTSVINRVRVSFLTVFSQLDVVCFSRGVGMRACVCMGGEREERNI